MTILVVDDEPTYRLMTRGILMNQGFEVVLAENGEEGLRKLAAAEIDLVISDIYMPGMDGIRFHRAVRANPKFQKLPFLFVSGFDDRQTFDVLDDPRCDGFFRKGRPVNEFFQWIHYFTAPEGSRPKFPPGSSRSNSNP
jgi:adenylate cyclase